MFVSDRWIKEAWKQKAGKEGNSVKDEIILTMQRKGKTVQFEGENMKLEGKIIKKSHTNMETSKMMIQTMQ